MALVMRRFGEFGGAISRCGACCSDPGNNRLSSNWFMMSAISELWDFETGIFYTNLPGSPDSSGETVESR